MHGLVQIIGLGMVRIYGVQIFWVNIVIEKNVLFYCL